MIYDVAIIGGGPAGATFARGIASNCEKVLLIDGQSEENPKPCGGLLAPDAQKVLAHFDLVLPKEVLADPQIFSVKTIDLYRENKRYYQRHYLNMDRYAFDRWLLSLVPDKVNIQNGKCLDIKRDEDIFILKISQGGKNKTFKTRQLVGADGANSIVRRTFFDSKIMHYMAIQQWFPAPKKITPFYSCIFDPKTSESCSWIIHKDDALVFGGCFLPQNCRKDFDRQKDRLGAFLGYEFGEVQKTEACITYRPKRWSDFETGRDGVYLIGEAAGFISASSFEGISSAILSGSMLSTTFARYRTPENIARHYRHATLKLRIKLMLKIAKRWFMYTPWVRNLIMRSGMSSIKVIESS